MDRTDRPVAILGAGGQLGRALTVALGSRGAPLTRQDVDLGDLPGGLGTLDRLAPGALIDAAAYTAVDKAESETDSAFRINGEAPAALARWAADRQIPFVHFSTDYVFDGSGSRPWTEDDPLAPLNAYGRSKAEGERAVVAEGGHWLIVRTSWVYDECGRNFLTTMLRLGRERETLSVVDDQWGAPTYAAHLARAVLKALDGALARPEFPSGVYHACNGGETTWRRFAEAIFAAARARGMPLTVQSVNPISTAEYPVPATRPLNSRLTVDKFRETFGITLPGWEAGVADCLDALSAAA